MPGAPADTIPSDTSGQTLVGNKKAGKHDLKGTRSQPHKEQEKPTEASKKPPRQKKQVEGEKVTVRRLPPGLTQSEFATILGPDWTVGNGKVDWFSFVPGKISTDPYKPSRPGRAYLHVLQKDLVIPLNEAVLNSSWVDAKNTYNTSSLISPPYVELATYKKTPSGRKRHDARQGTIDQDAEFMAFLEELANPVPFKEIDITDADNIVKEDAEPALTPLVEYLKEKKAQKAKDAAAAKSQKHARHDSGPGKGAKNAKEPDATSGSTKKRGKDSKPDKTTKEPVKILSKRPNAAEDVAAAAAAASSQPAASAAEDGARSRRAGIAAAARLLQKDLGLSPGSAHRRARQDAAKGGADSKATTGAPAGKAAEQQPSAPLPPFTETATQNTSTDKTTGNPKQQAKGRNRGAKTTEKGGTPEGGNSNASSPAVNKAKPVILKKTSDAPLARDGPSNGAPSTAVDARTKESTVKAAKAPKKAGGISVDATKAFVKNAHPSQGITEPALRSALEVFGSITSIEMERRKGFAYVDFAAHEGLVKAIQGSPVKVAQGSVQILERKEMKQKAPAPAANSGTGGNATTGGSEKAANAASGGGSVRGRGRRGRGGGGGANKSAGDTATTPAPSSTNAAANGG